MTDQELKELVASNAQAITRLEASQEQLTASQKELAASQQKTDKQVLRMLQGMAQIQNFISNASDVLEDQFYRAFLEELEDHGVIEIGKIVYDEIVKDLRGKTKKLQGQYDLVLFNSDHLFIAEVKSKPHVKDFEQMLKQKESFPAIFKDYADFQIHLGLAGEFFL